MIAIGDKAPELALPRQDHALTLAVFFKTGCPGCEYAFPFYERLYQAFKGTGLQVVGVSQHDPARTGEFVKKYGVTFPILNDEKLGASRKYDPDFVPTAFLIENGRIADAQASWNRDQLVELSKEIASKLNVKPPVLYEPGEDVLTYRAG